MKRAILYASLIVAVCFYPALAQQFPSNEGDETNIPGDEMAPVDTSPTNVAPPALPTAETNPAALPMLALEPKHLNTAILQGLNKVTARSSSIEAPIGEVVRFGNLEIIARSCWQSAAETTPEQAGLLEIWELKPEAAPARIFMGWMFASSPSLTSLEHPVYDVTVLRCEDKQLSE